MKRITGLIAIILFATASIFAQSWNYVTSTGTTFILYGMSFPTGQSMTGYACGMQYTYNADGVIVKTVDGGDNWTEILPVSGTIDGLQGIWFISETVGFAAGWNDYFIKTTDGGNTWTQINQSAGVWYYKDVVFWDSNNGLALGSMNSSGNQSVFVTSDGGNTWTPCASGMDNASIMGLSYATANIVYAVGTDANVYKSTDGGNNWSSIYTLPALLFGVEFADANFGVVGAEEKIFATNDGGASWTTFTTGYENFYATHALTNGTAYVGGTDENIYVTNDYGVSWTMEHNGSGTSSLYRIREVESSALFACGSQGTIITREAQFGAAFEASADSVCVGGSIDFTDLSLGNIVSWNWSFEGGTPATSSDQNPTITYNSIGTYDVTLEVSDGTNTDTYTVMDMITVIEIAASPATPSGDIELCGGETGVYTIDPVSGAEEYSWDVYPSDAGSITGNGTSATFNSDDSYLGNYYIKVRTHNMCGYSDWSDSLLCTLNLMPEAFFLDGGGSYCEGGTGLEITLDGSETGVDYELLLEGVSTGTILPGTGNPLSFGYQTESGNYSVNGFTSSCSQLMVGIPFIYIIDVPEQGNIPEGESEVCSGSESTYSIDDISNASSIIWTLIPEDAGEISGTGLEISVLWNDEFSGIATLTTMGENDCGAGNESDPLEIEVFLAPTPVISGPNTVCDQEEAEYSTVEVTGNSYEWNVTGGEILSGAGTSVINVLWGDPGIGTIYLTETSGGICQNTTDDFNVTIDECTSVDELNKLEMSIYPNPATDVITIKFNFIIEKNYSIIISNLMGQELLYLKDIGNENAISIDVSHLPSAQYLISILASDNQNLTREILIIE
jgi:photosystem II stability/assembly factor-like uncharacterized protein